jgi:hypothetical protein
MLTWMACNNLLRRRGIDAELNLTMPRLFNYLVVRNVPGASCGLKRLSNIKMQRAEAVKSLKSLQCAPAADLER